MDTHPDPTFYRAASMEERDLKCTICVHHVRDGFCEQRYAGFYHCKNERDGFKSVDDDE